MFQSLLGTSVVPGWSPALLHGEEEEMQGSCAGSEQKLSHLLDCRGARKVRLPVKGGMVPRVDGRNPDAADVHRLGVHAQLMAQILDDAQLSCNEVLAFQISMP